AARRAACGLSARTGRSGWRSRRRSTAEVKTSIPCLLPHEIEIVRAALERDRLRACSSRKKSWRQCKALLRRSPNNLVAGCCLSSEQCWERGQGAHRTHCGASGAARAVASPLVAALE